MKNDSNYDFKMTLKKATLLFEAKTTTSGVCSDFENGRLPFFFNSYHPEKSFMAVPPEFLKALAQAAGEDSLTQRIDRSIEDISKEKERIIKQIRRKTELRLKNRR